MNYFDFHCDTAFELLKQNTNFTNTDLAVNFQGGEHFENWFQTFAIWIDDTLQYPFQIYQKTLENLKEKLKNKPQNLTPIFSVEGGSLIEGDLEKLDLLKKDKIRFLTLTWNGENAIGGGLESDKDLTDFGKKVIAKLNDLKIATDLSHANKKTFYSAIEIADFPIETHSNCFEIHPHKRNLTLEQMRLIAQKNGIIGLNFYPPFLGQNVFEKIFENIYYLCQNGLENNIAIGSDFDGAKMSKKLDKINKIPYLYEFLSNKGLKRSILDKIFFENGYNYIAKM